MPNDITEFLPESDGTTWPSVPLILDGWPQSGGLWDPATKVGLWNAHAQAMIERSNNLKKRLDDLVSGAPGALDTLQEIADALNDDANLAATLTAQIADAASLTEGEIADGRFPARLREIAPKVDNLDTWNKTGPIRFSPTAIGSPPNDFDGRGIHIQGPNQASQIAVMGTELVMFRDKDTDGAPWGKWTELLNQYSGQELAYSTGNAPDNWLIGENFAGDTSVSLGEVWGRCHRIGNMAQIALKLNFSGFSIPANTDNTVSTSVDINALAAAAGWFAEIDGNSLGDVRAQFTGSTWDSPPFSMYCSTSKSAGTIFLSCNDMTHLGAQSSNATALDVTLTLYLKVKD